MVKTLFLVNMWVLTGLLILAALASLLIPFIDRSDPGPGDVVVIPLIGFGVLVAFMSWLGVRWYSQGRPWLAWSIQMVVGASPLVWASILLIEYGEVVTGPARLLLVVSIYVLGVAVSTFPSSSPSRPPAPQEE